ncbi:dihydroorotase, mitochondrial-like protein isoform X2, partial [Tanacetum coccineum]
MELVFNLEKARRAKSSRCPFPDARTHRPNRSKEAYKYLTRPRQHNASIIRYTFMIPHVHGEVTNLEINIFDRERVFIDTILKPLIQKFPRLKTVMKHVTTMDAIKFVESYDEGHVAIIVTSQHLLNRKSIFQQGLKQQLLPFANLKQAADTDAKIQCFVRENMAFMSILDNCL